MSLIDPISAPRERPAGPASTLTLDAAELKRRGVMVLGGRTRGVITWHDQDGQLIGSVAYEADLVDAADRWLRLRFSVLIDGRRRQIDQRVAITATQPGLGGTRLWFVEDGKRCSVLCLSAGDNAFRSQRGLKQT